MGKSTMTYERITPEKAQEYLSHNINNNRIIVKKRIDLYAHDMMSGNWSDNGETIKFNSNGCLIDGQHRLRAIIASGTTQFMWVAWGVDQNAFMTVDTGMGRSAFQIIKMQSSTDPLKANTSITSIVNQLFLLYSEQTYRPSIFQIEECIESNRETLEWYYSVSKWRSSGLPSPYHVCSIIMHLHNEKNEDIFGFINSAWNNDFNSGKSGATYKIAIQAEKYRKSHIVNRMDTQRMINRCAYSFAKNLVRITHSDDPYKCIMDSKFKLIPYYEKR